ncbi:MAG: beta-hydroxyacyl-ACP dehydratase [Acetobacteraceae bacterium]|nr:beta-hydroxyacyl-ACP dehydratase [Acetobacteraceae bacterium]
MRLEYFQMIDRIAALDLAARTIAIDCTLPEQSPIFEGHFPGYPIMPGVLMIETIAQAGGWLVMAGLRFRQMAFLAKVSEAKMRSFLAPGQAIRVEATQDHDGSGYAIVSGRIRSAGKLVCEATITYRVMNFPNPALREGLLEVARRVGVPAELMQDA